MTAGLPTPRRYFAVISVSAGTILLQIDSTIAAVALPTIAQALDIPSSSAVLVVTVYQLLLAMTIIPFSALADRIGHQRFYMAGMTIFIVASAASLLATNLPTLLLARAAQALSASAAMSVSLGMVRGIYPASQLGRGLGINTLAGSSGLAMAPAIGGLILSVASWHWVFVAAAPLAMLSLLTGRAVPDPAPHSEPFDLAGAALYAATVGLLILGFEGLAHWGRPEPALSIVAAAVAIGYGFVRYERRQPRPVLPIDLLAFPPCGFAVIAAFVGAIGSAVLLFSLPFRLQQTYGFGPAEIGAMIAPYAVASVMIAPASGMVSDYVRPILVSMAGIVVAIAAVLLVAFLPANPNYFDIAWRVWLCGAGFGMFLAPNARIIVASAPIERAAAAGGLITTTRMLGQASAATLLGALLALGVGASAAPALVAAGLTLVAGLSAALGPLRASRTQAALMESAK